jgi:8-oxo-dGTP diphosphatase
VPLYLVRHAKAGSRHHWEGPDEERPLTRAGRAQAEALATHLGGAPTERVLSSPYVRCVQTVEPLAAKVGTTVEITDALAEGRPFEPVLELLATLPDHSVLCTRARSPELTLRRAGRPCWPRTRSGRPAPSGTR